MTRKFNADYRAALTHEGNGNSTPTHDAGMGNAVRILREGGVLAVPTDTLYGLAADAFNPDAIERIFSIKERPEGMALPVLLADVDQLKQVSTDIPAAALALAETFWPGPLTLIVSCRDGVPPRLTAGQRTVAVRVPDHPVPRALARELGRPVTGTSANISGSRDPQTMEELVAQVGDRVDLVVASGPAPAGAASTIVDISGDYPLVVREGVIPSENIAAVALNR